MQLVVMQLESLFAEVVGLDVADRLPLMTLPPRITDCFSHITSLSSALDAASISNTSTVVASTAPTKLEAFDALPLYFSKGFLFASCSYMEELYQLATDLTFHNGRIGGVGGGASKKLRPYAVSRDIDSHLTSPTSGQRSGSISANRDGGQFTSKKENFGIQGKLVDAFFHQHGELKELCEFVVDATIKNVSNAVVDQIITPLFENGATNYGKYFNQSKWVDLDSFTIILHKIEQKAAASSHEFLQSQCDISICRSIRALAPPILSSKVIDIAISLAIEHAIQKGKKLIDSLIQNEIKVKTDDFLKKERKAASGVPVVSLKQRQKTKTSVKKMNTENAALRDLLIPLDDMTKSVRNFTKESNNKSGVSILESVVNKVRRESSATKEKLEKVNLELCATADGQAKRSVEEFDETVIFLLKHWCSSDIGDCQLYPEMLMSALDIVALLGHVDYFKCCLTQLTSFLCEPENLFVLIKNIVKAFFLNNSSDETISNCVVTSDVGDVLIKLTKGKIITLSSLERSLLLLVDSDEEESKAVASHCLKKLGGQSNGNSSKWMSNTSLVMMKLQKKMRQKAHRAPPPPFVNSVDNIAENA